MASSGMRCSPGVFFFPAMYSSGVRTRESLPQGQVATAVFTLPPTQGLELGDLFSTQMGCDRFGQEQSW